MSNGRKTVKMLQLERSLHGVDLVEAICRAINEHGQSEGARRLGLSKATLHYWCLKLGIKVRYVAVPKEKKLRVIPAEAEYGHRLIGFDENDTGGIDTYIPQEQGGR